VSGHVLDDQHDTVGYAVIELNGERKESDENGCFYFSGISRSSELDILITKVGYKPYRAVKEFDFYEVVITLTPEGNEVPSSAIWHKLYIEELGRFKTCSEK
jgi:hypothetical protein